MFSKVELPSLAESSISKYPGPHYLTFTISGFMLYSRNFLMLGNETFTHQ